MDFDSSQLSLNYKIHPSQVCVIFNYLKPYLKSYHMKHLKIFLTLLLTYAFHLSYAQKDILNIGVVTDCPTSSAPNFLIDNILKEAKILLKSEYKLVLDPENILQSDCNTGKIKENLDRLLADRSIDLILGVDGLSSHVMAKNGPYDKPVIAAVIINVQVQKIPITNKGSSGVKNLTYLELPYSPMRDMEVFYSMIGFQKLALVMDEAFFLGIPEMTEFLKNGLNELGVSHEFVFTEKTSSAVLAKLDDSFDAVYYFPSDNLSDVQYQELINGVNAKNLLSFSVLGRLDVDRGVLGGVAPASNIDLIARRIALNIQRIANREKAKDMNVKLPQKEELVINMATARAIDYSPSWEILAEAVLINEARDDIERSITIYSAIAEGLDQNLNIHIAAREVEIVTEDVNIAKSSLLPEVSASAFHTMLDNNTATNSFGQNPEHKGTAEIQLSQVIYSEQVTANKQVQELLLKASEAALDAQSLDIVLDVSTAYLNVMQAKTAEKIQKQNLDVTRKNLELARISSSVGQSGPSDLYRWQGEIATAKSNLLNATAQRKQAEMALNQILNRPINELFLTQEVDINDSSLSVNNQAISQYINNPRDFYQFADFMVAQAKANTPDLKQFDYNVRAQQRSVLLNERNKYVPTVSFGGSYDYIMYREGAGTEVPVGFGTPNDWNWNLQLAASLPIFQGGNRTARVQQSKVQLNQLNIQRRNTERLIEQQVRSELENVRASFRNINLTKDAEIAVVKNFELVQDSYSQGVVTITQLLDAQNAAISGQLNSANAIYIFFIDLLNMERATGAFYMLMTEEQKAEYVSQLESFFNR